MRKDDDDAKDQIRSCDIFCNVYHKMVKSCVLDWFMHTDAALLASSL